MEKLQKTLIASILLCFWGSLSWAQATLTGKVSNDQGESLSFAAVEIKGLSKGGYADAQGNYQIEGIPNGEYEVEASFVGYEPMTEMVSFHGAMHLEINFMLKPDAMALDAIEVEAESEAEEDKRIGYNVELLKTDELKNVIIDINQMIKTLPGVVIRETGGMGSSFDLSLNGLSGNQIRYFIDGVPMENYGASLALNNFPATLIENIEVYKGVVPIKFGSDALGGAINIVTDNSPGTLLDASYTFGSFNTHQGAINGKVSKPDKGYFVKLYSYFNYSDNNYKMYDMPLEDDLGNVGDSGDFDRFHSAYTSGMVNVKVGLIEKKYADELSIGLLRADYKKELQHSEYFITKPYHSFHGKGNSNVASMYYKKSFDRFYVSAFANYGLVEDSFVDTSGYQVNWQNQVIDTLADAEYFENKTLYTITDKMLRANQYLVYDINSNHKVQLNFSQNQIIRTGKDDINEFNTSFNEPSQVNKHVLGVSYLISNNKGSLSAELFGKQYWYDTKLNFTDNDVVNNISSSDKMSGYGVTGGWDIIDDLMLKASFEKAYRVPEGYEFLGDGLFVNPNLELEPEQSYNYNLELNYRLFVSKFNFQWALNGYWRETSNLIRLLAPNPVNTRYVNLDAVTTKGIELSFNLNYAKSLSLTANLTNQKMDYASGASVENEPLFFSNVVARYNLFSKRIDKNLVIQWQTAHTQEFFLSQPENGNQGKKVVPSQIMHSASIDYSFLSGKYNISIVCNNVFDALAYDNFKVQKPGRALYIKCRYLIKK
ncbi:TonB-dependent receptor [Aureibacter tunicatorum]|uniref:Outer membrane cobalamin receptor n=1 Tax=Aureibacter tunicatorum TaxID=866807 RepID=A0AAE4BV37_9BACT|nr:TonB-dependent receptor [Aureibacter tunicatorum]MDR6241393.1 outer membrane cobalamin receptor [Aureibacter tunicatorum]BDD06762.1 TonB-dependent receptor [Aureibacter tunicatorum]